MLEFGNNIRDNNNDTIDINTSRNNESSFQDQLNRTQNNNDNTEGINFNHNDINNQYSSGSEIENSSIDNISLDNSANSSNLNKKKYILLGLALITIFIITIIVVNIMSQEDDGSSQLIENYGEKKENILDNIDPEEKYKEIIAQGEQSLKEKNDYEDFLESIEEPTFDDKKISENIEYTNTFQNIPPPVEINIPEKVVEKPVVENLDKLFKAPKPIGKKEEYKAKEISTTGYFVQLSSFSKFPTRSYLSNIDKKGYSFKIVEVDVKGKTYHRILIGPYETKSKLRSKLSKIRADLNSPSAFLYNK
jgi:DedD protein